MIRAIVLLFAALAARTSLPDAGWSGVWHSLKWADVVVIGTIEDMHTESRTLRDHEVGVSFFLVSVSEVLKGDMANTLTDDSGHIRVAVRNDHIEGTRSLYGPMVFGLARPERQPTGVPTPVERIGFPIFAADPNAMGFTGTTWGQISIDLAPAEPFVLDRVRQSLVQLAESASTD